MIIFWSFNLKPSNKLKLSSIGDFDTLHLTSICFDKSTSTKKTASLYVFLQNEKILLGSLNKNTSILSFDLWFHCSQKCEFFVEGEQITLMGYFKTKPKEKDIFDEDEFKAIAFKANKVGQELQKLYNSKRKK